MGVGVGRSIAGNVCRLLAAVALVAAALGAASALPATRAAPRVTIFGDSAAEVLDSMPEVVSYAKNQGLNFKIPYTYEGRAANYVPDFLIRLRDDASKGDEDLLTLILEVTGEAKKEKQAKVAAAEFLWVEAVNNWGGAGRWAFLEVTDPWDAEHLIRLTFLDRAETPV